MEFFCSEHLFYAQFSLLNLVLLRTIVLIFSVFCKLKCYCAEILLMYFELGD